MLKLATLLATTLAVSVSAQCNPGTLTTNNVGGNAGNAGGGIYFDLTVNTTITITDINFRAGSTGSGGAGQMDIYLGPSTYVGNVTNAALWTRVAQTASTIINQNATATNPGILTLGPLVDPNTQLPGPITLGPGQYGIALASQATVFNHNYSNPGNPATFSTPELTINTGAAQNALFSGGIFTPRHWNGEIVYTCGGTPIAVASSEQYGNACYKYNTSYHELFPNPIGLDVDNQNHYFTADLGNSRFQLSAGATGYTAPGAGAIAAAPGPGLTSFSVATLLGGPLPFPIIYPRGGAVGIADDLEVCHSGYITPVDVAGNGTTAAIPNANAPDNTPTVAEFYGTAERWCPHWKTMDSSAGGAITVEVIGSPGSRQLVIDWAIVSGNTFQIVFHETTGDVEYRYQTMSGGGGGGQPVIIGWTQGNNALANEIDVSVATQTGTYATDPVDNTPLNLVTDARPQLGTNPNYVIDGYDAPSTILGALVLDLFPLIPGVELAAFGMTGCDQNILAPTAIQSFVTAGATSISIPIVQGGIPTSGGFNGLSFFGQAFTLTTNCAGNPCNATQVIASNGLRVFFGSL